MSTRRAVEGVVESPAVDDLQSAYAEVRRDPYVFQWADQQWSLPHLGALDYRLQAELESFEGLDVAELEALFARMFGPEQAARWAEVEVPTPVLSMLFERWVKHSGAKPGESPASTRSSGSTGKKSRPTSAATTTSASPKRSTAAKRAPRKAAKAAAPSAAELAARVDQEWPQRHQTLAGSQPAN